MAKILTEKQRATLFKPGQSGNPAGKTKGSVHFRTILQELLKQEVKNPAKGMFYVRDKKITAAQFLMIALFKRAAAGDLSAIKEIMDRADEVLVQINEVRHLRDEDEAILNDLLERNSRYAEYAKKSSDQE